jgi:DNA-binding NarL/FixJ family response regulator
MTVDLVSILVVEDEEPVFELIKLTLTKNKPSGWPLRYRIQNVPTLASAVRTLASVRFDVIILDLGLPDSGGIETFWKVSEVAKNLPVVVLTGADTEGLFERILGDGAYRCYGKTDLSQCMRMLHHIIRHVLHEYADNRLIAQQSEAIAGKLRPTIRACAGCDRWFDEQRSRWVSQRMYLKSRNIIESHGHCPDCHRDFYDEDLREATKDYE